MGKGRIVSGGEDGSYTIDLLHNRDRIEDELAFLSARLEEMQEELTELNAERANLVAERDAIPPQIDQAIADYQAQEVPLEEREPLDVEALLVELAQVSAQIQAQDVRIAMIEGRMLEANQRKKALEAIPADPRQQAWCADFTEDLTGDVATVEVPAEGVVGVQIRPGYEGRANYLPARDGQLHHREGQVGYQAYFNAAILPGVQRHKPQYRIGVITAVDKDADTCSLTIQGEDSSAQALIIDPPDLVYNKTDVPIEYMECNSDAFEVGDRVLVEFQGRDWDQPKVIGFEKEPKTCLPEYIVLHTRNSNQDRNITRWFTDGTSVPYVTPLVGNLLIRTDFTHGRENVNWSMPDGFPGFSNINLSSPIQGLHVTYWTTSIRWDEAQGFDEVVGGDEEVDAAPYRPDDWAIDEEIFVFKPSPVDLNVSFFYDDSERIAEIHMDSLQLPGNFNNVDVDRYAEVWGYDTFYRQTVSGKAFWQCTSASGENYQDPSPCAGETTRLLFHGDFDLQVVSTDVNDIDTLSQDVIPTTLTIKGVTYTRKDLGWVEDPDNTTFRLIAFVYARADVAGDPVVYAEGFWAE